MRRLQRSAPASSAGVDRIARELGAFLLLESVSPTHRLRASTALAHVAQLVHDDVNTFELHAGLSAAELVLELTLPRAACPPLDDAILNGLCEDCRRTLDGVRLQLSLPPTFFEEEQADLAERDYLTTDDIEDLLACLSGGTSEAPLVPEALTPTVGRLLASCAVTTPAEPWS